MFNPFKGLKAIFVVLFVSFDLHFFVAALAGNNRVFDEVYYVPAAQGFLSDKILNLEHPFLVKLVGGLSVGLLGDGWFAWRLPIIVCAVVCVYLTYLIAKSFVSERLSVFAAVLVSLSTVFLLTGSFFLLDIPCLMFGLAGVLFVLKKNYWFGGLLFGVSFLCKELAVVMFGAVFLYLVLVKAGKWNIVLFSAIGFAVAFCGMWIYDLVYQPMVAGAVIDNPVQHIYLMVMYQLKLNNLRAHDLVQWYPPLSWVSPFGVNAFNPLSWLWSSVGDKVVYSFVAQPNAAVEYLMFPLLILLPVVYWFKRNSVALFSWLWLASSFLPWFIVGFFVRTEANFYVVYSVPFLAIGCVYLYSLIKSRRVRIGLACVHLFVGVMFFLYYFPLHLF